MALANLVVLFAQYFVRMGIASVLVQRPTLTRSVRPHYSFHAVSYQPDCMVTSISDVRGADLWVNGGYCFFRREVFDYIHEGEDLVQEPFQRLIAARELIAYRYEGFWTALDTLKDLQSLESLHDSGHPPWAPWTSSPTTR
jgi:glucose-1-phosphate cytidylyltransferase